MSLLRLLPVWGDAGVLAGARVVAYVIATVTPIVLARRLAVEDMGGYRDILLVSFTAMQVLQLGLPASLFYLLPGDRSARWTAVTHSLLVLGVVAILLIVGLTVGGELLANWFQFSELSELAFLIGVFVGASVLTTLLEPLPIADGRIALASMIALGSELARSALLFVVAVVWPSLIAIAVALVAFGVLRTLALLAVTQPYWTRRPWLNRDMAQAQVAFAGPFALAQLLTTGASTVDKFAVSSLFGPAAFAIYSLGLTQVPLVEIFFNSQAEVVLSRMKVSRDAGDVETIRALWVVIVRRMSAFVLPTLALLALIGNDLIVALYGERYAASGIVFSIWVFHLLRYVAPYGVLPRVYGETVFILWVSVFSLIGTLITLAVGMTLWGYLGAAVANVISMYLVTVPQVIKGHQLLGVPLRTFMPWGSLVRLAACSAAGAAAVVLLRPLLAGPQLLQLAVAGAAFAGVYMLGLQLSGELRAITR